MLKRILAAVALFALCALAVVRVSRPPRPVPATSPDTVFSAERAMRYVEDIAVRPHAVGMPDHDRVRDYIVAQLTAMGLHPQVQATTGIGTRYQEAGRVQNILASIPGSDPNGKAVLLMAHYDGVEAGPAAADDGAGCAALLEVVRALRARKTPLVHDVIILFTDGEEAGLLGAAAFVREHVWAKDVAAVVNLEARGTTGRSFMFETGPGNLDAARALRSAGDVTAGSVFSAVYRILPNDTDLSELAVLNLPALNFAFAEGVERYHTSHDDYAHLNPGSVQHHGDQMLAVARVFANGPLPRPRTGDGVYFDLPVLGLVVYTEWVAIPLAVIAIVLVGVASWREWRGALYGVVTAIAGVVVAALVARPIAGWIHLLQAHMPSDGAAQWGREYIVALALFAAAIALAFYALARRWVSDRGLDAGVLVVWLIPAVGLSIKLPAASYLFVWPLLFAALALVVPAGSRWSDGLGWVAAALAILIVIGFAYGVSGVMLGVAGIGATVLAVLASLVTLLIAPQIRLVARNNVDFGAVWVAVAGVLMVVVGLFAVRRSADHPAPSAIAYVENADSAGAWLGEIGRYRDPWTHYVLGDIAPGPTWTSRLGGSRVPFVGRQVARVTLGAPNATLVRDTLVNGARRVVLRVTAPRGTTALFMRATGAKVSTSSIDGRVVDTTRYRRRSDDWHMQYWAVPDSGAIVALSIPPGSAIDFEMTSRYPGLPVIPGVSIPARPESVVPAQTGDASYVYKRLHF
jgi:MFS family permease